MINARAVVNPFTKHDGRMRRDSHGMWRSTKDENTSLQSKPGPSKAVQFVTPQSRYLSQTAGPEILSGQSQLPQTSAAIYDVEDLYDLPDAYTRLSVVPSWSGLGNSRYDDEGISPKTLTHTSKPIPHATVSPLRSNFAAGRDSLVSAIESIGFSHAEEVRKESNATVFPHFPYIIEKPEPKRKKAEVTSAGAPVKSSAPPTQGMQDPWKVADIYHDAKGIYKNGPKGDGQKLWAGYKQFRKQKHTHGEVKQDKGKQKHFDIQLPLWLPTAGLAAHPLLYNQPAPKPRAFDVAPKQPYARKASDNTEGGLSLSSCEVPVRIDANMQCITNRNKPLPQLPRQVVDTNKPLPAVPMLRPAPRSRKYNEHNRPRPAQTKTSKEEQQQQHGNAESPAWWKVLAVKMPEIEVPTFHHEDSDADKLKAHQKLKSKISRPALLSLNENSTTNIPILHGGVGGPGTHVSRPPVTLDRFTARQKGKQKVKDDALTKHWRDILNNPLTKQGAAVERRRKSSDATFGCVGVDDYNQLYFQEPGPWKQYQAHVQADTDEEETRPEPLFLGMRGGKERPRDTRFYQPYYDVLSEYHGGRRGRG
jgi:hypothetical protein